jgi:hypothetical protein
MLQMLENVTVKELNDFIYPGGINRPLHRIVRTGPISQNQIAGTDELVWKIRFVLLQTIEMG